MWAAIAQAIGSIAGTSVKGNLQNNQNQFNQYEESLQFSQAKDMAFYNAYQSSTKQIAIIAAIAFAFLALIVFLALRNK